MEFVHLPVMPRECIEGLAIKPDGIYLDGTTGGGGHSLLIAERLGESGRLIAFDKDEEALRAAKNKLKDHLGKVTFVHDDFASACGRLDELGIEALDGVLLDLGVSSYQIDNAERGFSYIKDAPLDMRMDRGQDLDAYKVVNGYPREKLESIFRDYGEERLARRIAAKIEERRAEAPVATTLELAELVAGCYPPGTRYKYGNPAKRVFQAIRIEVNGELDRLSESVTALARRLRRGGRMAVITFHSLEDRIVKNAFRELSLSCTCPPDFPVCVCGKVKEVELVNAKPITASPEELKANPRAESAKLRIVKRI
ncbi:MAG TPA: 16S rRNA (cytosine(1402)-N(4))-methyltransferase RsmH [Candidatus Limadaptatus stercoripullorum]|uniref:Ribosomal RNA small subunit methyltransferase H n=1 Tax=Candidatus Limadaptatus stercoripullorum TaxID=2840846 RepID=A0A9D1SW65_9FIRM|nr:16S rRNA (cytosine(1402)-N(4))-methyltransferase RsmH [Candidatus Limadaptatus stercoripullorum]